MRSRPLCLGLGDVRRDDAVPLVLSAQKHLDQLARRSVAAACRADPVDARADVLCRVGRRRGKPRSRQHGQIEYVVSHIRDLIVAQPESFENLLIRFQLARDALVHQRHAELPRTLRRRGRHARREESNREPQPLRPHDSGPVLDVELFALAAVRVQEDLAVGQHAVDIEQHEPDRRRFDRQGHAFVHVNHDHTKLTAVVLPPLTITPTRSPGAGVYAPAMSAAVAAAPPGSATMRSASQSVFCAARMSSSVTSTVRSTYFCAIANISVPTRRGASESAAIPPAGASTGSPARMAIVNVGASTGSTPTTRTRPSYHAASPPIKPPPPTATSTVSSFGACPVSSRPSEPWPRIVSG